MTFETGPRAAFQAHSTALAVNSDCSFHHFSSYQHFGPPEILIAAPHPQSFVPCAASTFSDEKHYRFSLAVLAQIWGQPDEVF